MNRQPFHFREEPLNRFPALAVLKPFVRESIRLYVVADQPDISRKSQQGLWLFTAIIDGLEYAFACSDFRMNGGSLGIENSRRFLAFLAYGREQKLPLVFLINSMGVSFFEGRTVFNEAFSLIPALETYKKNAGVFTIALKNVFGLAALLFGLGSYRIALHQQSLINLAGPQVFRLFFGRTQSFNTFAEVNSSTRSGKLIHEICHGPEHALARVFELNRFFVGNTGTQPNGEIRLSTLYDRKTHSKALEKAHLAATKIINSIADEGMEIFPGFDTRLKVFLCKIDGCPAGILINPIGFADTLLTSNTLNLYTEALDFFRQCRLPVISILDTPGADPSMVQGDYRIIETMLAASKAIIDYPHMKIGVIAGRAFGGATVLGFPKIFGGHTNLAFRQAELGIMKAEIIESLLSSSDKMLDQWQAAAEDMTKNLDDLIDCNIIDKVIEEHELKKHLADLLHSNTSTTGL